MSTIQNLLVSTVVLDEKSQSTEQKLEEALKARDHAIASVQTTLTKILQDKVDMLNAKLAAGK